VELTTSSLLNDAHRILKDPIKRTEYLLKLEGVELEEQSKTATEQRAPAGKPKSRSFLQICWKKYSS